MASNRLKFFLLVNVVVLLAQFDLRLCNQDQYQSNGFSHINATLGDNLYIPCINNLSQDLQVLPYWNITHDVTELFTTRDLPAGYSYNGTGLFADLSSPEMNLLYFSCCYVVELNSSYSIICGQTTKVSIIADCGDPEPPTNGSVITYSGTSEGDLVHFQCRRGLFPFEEQTAVCTLEGKWNPDPGQVECTSYEADTCAQLEEGVQLNDTVVADITTESANLRFVCTSTEDTMLRISLKPTQNSTIGEQSKTTTCQSENKEVSFDHLMSSTEYIIRASVQKEFNNQILLVCGNLYRENFNTKSPSYADLGIILGMVLGMPICLLCVLLIFWLICILPCKCKRRRRQQLVKQAYVTDSII